MLETPPFFSVLIVNYNGGEYLQGAIDSLKKQTFQNFEVICIDNNSTDNSVDTLDTQGIAHFALEKQADNLGFAKGNNVGAKLAKGRWLALLNPDTIADPDWLLRVHEATQKYTHCKVFACAQLSLDHPELLDGAGDSYHIFGIPWRGGFERPIEELPEEGTCFSPCGASAIYERELFMSYNGFDERFFCYCEDVDLGYRMQLDGEPCIFLPGAILSHKGSGTSGRDSYFTMFHGNRNRTWTYIKNTPLPLLILTLPGHLFIIGYIYMRNRSTFKHEGMLDGIREGLKQGWQLRRDSSYRVTRPRGSLLHLMRQMAFNPFIMSNRKVFVKPLSK